MGGNIAVHGEEFGHSLFVAVCCCGRDNPSLTGATYSGGFFEFYSGRCPAVYALSTLISAFG